MRKNGTRAQSGERKQKRKRKKKQVYRGGTPEPKTLPELGVTRKQSSKWQQLSDIPEQEFETEISRPGTKPTTEGLLAKRKQQEPVNPIDVKALQAWGRILDFERFCLLESDPTYLLNEMTEPMRENGTRARQGERKRKRKQSSHGARFEKQTVADLGLTYATNAGEAHRAPAESDMPQGHLRAASALWDSAHFLPTKVSNMPVLGRGVRESAQARGL